MCSALGIQVLVLFLELLKLLGDFCTDLLAVASSALTPSYGQIYADPLAMETSVLPHLWFRHDLLLPTS